MDPVIVFTEKFGVTAVTVALYGECGVGRLDSETRIAKHRAEQLHWTRPKAREGRPMRSFEERAYDREWRE